MSHVVSSPLCFDCSLLPSEFRYLHKRGLRYWEIVRRDWHTGSGMGYLLQYKMVEVDTIHSTPRVARYVALPRHWALLESPRVCSVAAPPVVTYAGSYLARDPASGLWVVAYTELVAKMVLYIFWDDYDTQTLCYLSPTVIHYIRKPDLSPL